MGASNMDYIHILNQYVNAAARLQANKITEKLDKQIQGTIMSIEDESLGKYKIQYQDCVLYAYSQNGQKYSKKDKVYISIPENDMNQKKYIIGEAPRINNIKLLKTEDFNNHKNFCYFDPQSLPKKDSGNNIITTFDFLKISNNQLVIYNDRINGYVSLGEKSFNNPSFDEKNYSYFIYDSVNANDNLYWKISFEITDSINEIFNRSIYEKENKIIRNIKKYIDFGCIFSIIKNQEEYIYIFNLDSLEGTSFSDVMEGGTPKGSKEFYIPIRKKDEFINLTQEQIEEESLCGVNKISFYVNILEDILEDEDNFYTENGETFKIIKNLDDFYQLLLTNPIIFQNLEIKLVKEKSE